MRCPPVFSVIEQLPAATGALQALTPSVTVTVPESVEPLCTPAAIVYDTTTACPGVDGPGVCVVIVVVVGYSTRCVAVAEPPP